MAFPSSPPASTSAICGTFTEPNLPDQGQPGGYRTKIDCEAPVLPVPRCPDSAVSTTYNAALGTFVTTSTLFDSTCSAILDSFGNPITTQS